MTPTWLSTFIIGGGFGAVLTLFAIWVFDWIRNERQTKGDPIQAWDETQKPGLIIVSASSESDLDVCDAFEALRLAGQGRAGAEG